MLAGGLPEEVSFELRLEGEGPSSVMSAGKRSRKKEEHL